MRFLAFGIVLSLQCFAANGQCLDFMSAVSLFEKDSSSHARLLSENGYRVDTAHIPDYQLDKTLGAVIWMKYLRKQLVKLYYDKHGSLIREVLIYKNDKFNCNKSIQNNLVRVYGYSRKKTYHSKGNLSITEYEGNLHEIEVRKWKNDQDDFYSYMIEIVRRSEAGIAKE